MDEGCDTNRMTWPVATELKAVREQIRRVVAKRRWKVLDRFIGGV